MGLTIQTNITTAGVVQKSASGESYLLVGVPTTFTTGVISPQFYTSFVGSGTFTIEQSFAGTMIEVDPTSGSAIVALPLDISSGFFAGIRQIGSGSVTFASSGGSTINSVTGSTPQLRTEWSHASIDKRNSTQWIVAGDIT